MSLYSLPKDITVHVIYPFLDPVSVLSLRIAVDNYQPITQDFTEELQK